MINENDVVLMMPESYVLPDLGFSELLTLDEPKTGKTLSEYQIDLLKTNVPQLINWSSGEKVRSHFCIMSEGKQVFEKSIYPNLVIAILPDNLRHIEHEAFVRHDHLVYIRIPRNVQYIGQDAFRGCYFARANFVNDSALDGEKNGYWGAKIVDEEIDGMLIKDNELVFVREGEYDSFNIPNTVTRIGEKVFHISDITSITIPNSVTYIGESAFSDCYGLTSITIPDSVKRIEKEAFYCCDNLTKIICQALTPPKIGEESIDSSCQPTIYVPQGAVAAYQADADWGKFTIQAIP